MTITMCLKEFTNTVKNLALPYQLTSGPVLKICGQIYIPFSPCSVYQSSMLVPDYYHHQSSLAVSHSVKPGQ